MNETEVTLSCEQLKKETGQVRSIKEREFETDALLRAFCALPGDERKNKSKLTVME